jgi:hypothetical protein
MRMSKLSWWLIGSATTVTLLYLSVLTLIEWASLSNPNPITQAFNEVEHAVLVPINAIYRMVQPPPLKK